MTGHENKHFNKYHALYSLKNMRLPISGFGDKQCLGHMCIYQKTDHHLITLNTFLLLCIASHC